MIRICGLIVKSENIVVKNQKQETIHKMSRFELTTKHATGFADEHTIHYTTSAAKDKLDSRVYSKSFCAKNLQTYSGDFNYRFMIPIRFSFE